MQEHPGPTEPVSLPELPTGDSDFVYMRHNKSLYVDKTAYIARMILNGRFYFLSRPRRFGKSLTVSTLNALFSGRKELFAGLDVERHLEEETFQPGPVLRLDMSKVKPKFQKDITLETLQYNITSRLEFVLENNADKYNVKLRGKEIDTIFENLILDLSKEIGKVAILIDEYDYVMIESVNHGNLFLEETKDLLRNFFSKIKDCVDHVRFVFITGITRFSKMGIFSALNNLHDISVECDYAAICGYTQEEFDDKFKHYMPRTADILTNGNVKKLRKKIKEFYDGFSFDGVTLVYNPFSTLLFFANKRFGMYWFLSGTPSIIAYYIKRHRIIPQRLRKVSVGYTFIQNPGEINESHALSYLYQTGYLSLRYKKSNNSYTLDYPNEEVLQSMSALLAWNLFDSLVVANQVAEVLNNAIDNLNAEAFVAELNRLLAIIPYDDYAWANIMGVPPLCQGSSYGEKFYRAVLLSLLTGAGMKVRAETHVSQGRSDLIIEAARTWVIELKIARTTADVERQADDAMAQIHTQGYARPYRDPVLLGVAIDGSRRWIGGYRLNDEPFRAVDPPPITAMPKAASRGGAAQGLPALPAGGQDFAGIRKHNRCYVDKTAHIARMVTEGDRCFLSRPCGFGKSLTVSTLDALFSGRSELFVGLAIEGDLGSEELQPGPVLRIDMTMVTPRYHKDTPFETIRNDIHAGLADILSSIADRHGVELHNDLPPKMLGSLIKDVNRKAGKVIILVDDYDNMLVESINHDGLYFEATKALLQEFFAQIKACSNCIRFVFITGVTRFSMTGILSKITNLVDITNAPEYGDMIGFTRDEITTSFKPYLVKAAESLTNDNENELLDKMEEYYAGFCFDGETHVFNPSSTLSFFRKKQFGNYWFDGGTSSVLAEYMKEQHVIVDSFRNMQVPMSFVTDPDELDTAQAVDYLLQNGYLTLREGKGPGLYGLDYPNNEVYTSLSSLMTRNMFGDKRSAEIRTAALSQALTNGDAENVVLAFDALLGKVGYEDYARANEADVTMRHPNIAFGEWLYRALLSGFAAGTGIPVQPKAPGSQGGAAMVVSGQGRTWVIGITVAKTAGDVVQAADEAMRQAGETADARSLDNPIRLAIAIDDGIRRIGGYRLDDAPFRAVGAAPRPAAG